MVCAQLTPGPTATAGLVLPLRGRSTELYARHGFQVTRPVEHRPGTGSGWGEGSEGREGCRRRGLRLPGTWGNAECHQEAHSRSREAATAPTVDSVAPGPHSPAPVLPASCGTGWGAGTGTPRSARLRVRVPCEAWMCSSCRLSPPVSAVLASAVLSRLGRSCLTRLPKPTLPSPPRQRPALLRCALRVIPGTLLSGSVPPRVTACRCLFPACLARLQPFTQVGGEGPGSRPLLEPAQCC